MKISALLLGIVLAGAPAAAALGAETVVAPGAEKWGPAPPSLPPGAQAAVLYGDPGKPGTFVVRFKAPKGYHVPPHTHPRAERVTVLSGAISFGMGKTADRSKATRLGAGGFFSVDPDMAHYVWTDADTVLQVATEGPFEITYVNPADDPRNKKK